MRRLGILTFVLAAAIFGAFLGGRATAGDDAADAPKPLALHNLIDPVTGMEASSKSTLVWEGLEIQFACGDSVTKFQADPAGFAVELLRDLAAQRDALHAKLAAVHGALKQAMDAAAPASDSTGCPCGGSCPCGDGKCKDGKCGDCKDGCPGKCKEGKCGDCKDGCPGKCKDAKTGAPVEPAKPAPTPAPAAESAPVPAPAPAPAPAPKSAPAPASAPTASAVK